MKPDSLDLNTLRHQSSEALAKRFEVKEQNPLLEKFASLGLPTKKSEAYRYFDAESLLEKEYKTLAYVPREIQEADKLEIVNGVVTTAPKDLRVYYGTYAEIVSEHYDPLYFLGHLLSPNVIIIEIDGDREIELLHRYTQRDTLIHYRIVIKNQANRHATIYESFDSEDAKGSLVLYGCDITVARDSTLRIIRNQTINDDAYHMIASHYIRVEKQANIILKTFDFGNTSALQLFKVDLGEYACIDAGHLLYLSGKAKRGSISQIVHQGEHSSSVQEAKNILEGDARGIFDALIRVEHTAKHSKAQQNSKSILLNVGTYMVAKPQLEIYIDELEASHGATTGQLDEKQLFYLQSRGISRQEAKKMLIIAFANTLIETVKDARHQEMIQESFEKAFYAKKDR
ncbi:MAG: SufD family Fe-S cluster assembly protein [Campylobacterota bacterium]|nr:SufD family Fe-S cluster assembly protein [Campylobacterota bacterium]